MITTSDVLPGHEITKSLGVVTGVAEKAFLSASIGNVAVVTGGGLSELVEEAKGALIILAVERGANGIVGFRYQVGGRELEKA